MPARTGQQYIDGLSKIPAEVWISGEKVEDVTTHSAFKNGVRSLASLYDMQHNPATKEALRRMGPQLIAHLYIVALIILGNVIHFTEKKRGVPR